MGFVAREEVSVTVEGGGDSGVAHVGAEGFGVDAGRDHEGGVAVPAFVEVQRIEACGFPGCSRAGEDCPGVEGAAVAVDVIVCSCALADAVGDEVASEGRRERNPPSSRSAFRVDQTRSLVPGVVDVDEVVLEVDLVPGQCLQFASAKTRVERGCPERLVSFGECCD